MCVGSNPTPVFKRFQHDEAEPSADEFCHTGKSIQDDSAKQKKTKKPQRRLWLITELFETAQKKIPRRHIWNTNDSVGLNANLYKWTTHTVYQIKSLKCKFEPIENSQIKQKNVGVNPAGWPRF